MIPIPLGSSVTAVIILLATLFLPKILVPLIMGEQGQPMHGVKLKIIKIKIIVFQIIHSLRMRAKKIFRLSWR